MKTVFVLNPNPNPDVAAYKTVCMTSANLLQSYN